MLALRLRNSVDGLKWNRIKMFTAEIIPVALTLFLFTAFARKMIPFFRFSLKE